MVPLHLAPSCSPWAEQPGLRLRGRLLPRSTRSRNRTTRCSIALLPFDSAHSYRQSIGLVRRCRSRCRAGDRSPLGRRTDRARGRTWSGHPRLGRGLCECRGAWMTGTSPVKETSFTCANMPQSSCTGATFQKSTRVWVPAATTAWIERPPLLITMAFSTTTPPPRLIVMKPVQFESTM
jgi:hypothetical protein